MHLPTRPTKQSDARSKNFVGDSVEVDAIDPRVLRAMVEEVIVQHVDPEERARLETVEQAERETLANLATVMSGNGDQATYQTAKTLLSLNAAVAKKRPRAK
jgi:hypothetical protein